MTRWKFDHFSLFAPFYDRMFDFLDPTRLRELLELPTAGRLLDAGGGTGRVAQALRGLAGQIVVTDLSAAMLHRAAGKDGLYPVRAHTERLPFPDASFDRILVVDAFHHFCDQQEAVAELWRVLVPGGRLVIEEPNVETWPVKLVALAERLALMRSRFYSPGDLQRLFQALGGRVEVYADHAFNAWVVVEK
jgi:demethylmenaquinone methyltransferase/2-methoxy-6-polyprenyl-1,4-benzoquinol methylase